MIKQAEQLKNPRKTTAATRYTELIFLMDTNKVRYGKTLE